MIRTEINLRDHPISLAKLDSQLQPFSCHRSDLCAPEKYVPARSGEAIALVEIDQIINENVLNKIKNLPQVVRANVINFK